MFYETGIGKSLNNRKEWLQGRHNVISENVANAYTPTFQGPNELRDLGSSWIGGIPMFMTHEMHASNNNNGLNRLKYKNPTNLDAVWSGAKVSVTDEIAKMGENNVYHQAVCNINKKFKNLFKIVFGKQ
jgi:flagellar basal-body rod protein FlgB